MEAQVGGCMLWPTSSYLKKQTVGFCSIRKYLCSLEDTRFIYSNLNLLYPLRDEAADAIGFTGPPFPTKHLNPSYQLQYRQSSPWYWLSNECHFHPIFRIYNFLDGVAM